MNVVRRGIVPVLLAVAMVLTGVAHTPAGILMSDNFNADTVGQPVEGTLPDVSPGGQAWSTIDKAGTSGGSGTINVESVGPDSTNAMDGQAASGVSGQRETYTHFNDQRDKKLILRWDMFANSSVNGSGFGFGSGGNSSSRYLWVIAQGNGSYEVDYNTGPCGQEFGDNCSLLDSVSAPRDQYVTWTITLDRKDTTDNEDDEVTVQFDSTVIGTFDFDDLPNTGNGDEFAVSMLTNSAANGVRVDNVQLFVNEIPEPSSLALALCATCALGLLGGRRRRS